MNTQNAPAWVTVLSDESLKESIVVAMQFLAKVESGPRNMIPDKQIEKLRQNIHDVRATLALDEPDTRTIGKLRWYNTKQESAYKTRHDIYTAAPQKFDRLLATYDAQMTRFDTLKANKAGATGKTGKNKPKKASARAWKNAETARRQAERALSEAKLTRASVDKLMRALDAIAPQQSSPNPAPEATVDDGEGEKEVDDEDEEQHQDEQEHKDASSEELHAPDSDHDEEEEEDEQADDMDIPTSPIVLLEPTPPAASSHATKARATTAPVTKKAKASMVKKTAMAAVLPPPTDTTILMMGQNLHDELDLYSNMLSYVQTWLRGDHEGIDEAQCHAHQKQAELLGTELRRIEAIFATGNGSHHTPYNVKTCNDLGALLGRAYAKAHGMTMREVPWINFDGIKSAAQHGRDVCHMCAEENDKTREQPVWYVEPPSDDDYIADTSRSAGLCSVHYFEEIILPDTERIAEDVAIIRKETEAQPECMTRELAHFLEDSTVFIDQVTRQFERQDHHINVDRMHDFIIGYHRLRESEWVRALHPDEPTLLDEQNECAQTTMRHGKKRKRDKDNEDEDDEDDDDEDGDDIENNPGENGFDDISGGSFFYSEEEDDDDDDDDDNNDNDNNDPMDMSSNQDNDNDNANVLTPVLHVDGHDTRRFKRQKQTTLFTKTTHAFLDAFLCNDAVDKHVPQSLIAAAKLLRGGAIGVAYNAIRDLPVERPCLYTVQVVPTGMPSALPHVEATFDTRQEADAYVTQHGPSIFVARHVVAVPRPISTHDHHDNNTAT